MGIIVLDSCGVLGDFWMGRAVERDIKGGTI